MSIHSIIKALHERITALENTHYALGVRHSRQEHFEAADDYTWEQGDEFGTAQETTPLHAKLVPDASSIKEYQRLGPDDFLRIIERSATQFPQAIMKEILKTYTPQGIYRYENDERLIRYIILWKQKQNNQTLGLDIQLYFTEFVVGFFSKQPGGLIQQTGYWNVPKNYEPPDKELETLWASIRNVIEYHWRNPHDVQDISFQLKNLYVHEQTLREFADKKNRPWVEPRRFARELPDVNV